MNTGKKVAVLLSTYNGDSYVKQQIESIYLQKNVEVMLYVRDDGSDRQFVEQLRELQKQYQFQLIEGNNLGFVGSFMTLLKEVPHADYYAFCDQDDIWLEHKLEQAVDWFETYGTPELPQLYHCAYQVIDRESKVVDYVYYEPQQYDFRRSITENHYSGFAMVINETLRQYMLKGDYSRIGYHDWWAAMIVNAFGSAYSDTHIYALHRAHGDNVTAFTMKSRFLWLKNTFTGESDIHRRATEFERCFGGQLSFEQKKWLNLFTGKTYRLGVACRKCFSLKRWRPVWSSELVLRFLMLTGRV